MSLHTNYILWVIVGLLITGLFSFFLYKREKKLRATKAAAETEGIVLDASAEAGSGENVSAQTGFEDNPVNESVNSQADTILETGEKREE